MRSGRRHTINTSSTMPLQKQTYKVSDRSDEEYYVGDAIMDCRKWLVTWAISWGKIKRDSIR